MSAALYPTAGPAFRMLPRASWAGVRSLHGMQIVQNLAIMGTDWVKVDVLDRLRRGMPINPVEAHRVQQIWSLSRVADGSLCLLQGWCS